MSRSSRRRSRRDLFRSGDAKEHLTGLDRLPRAVRLDYEREESYAPLVRPRAVETVYPWASSRQSRDARGYLLRPLAKPAKGRLSSGRVFPSAFVSIRLPGKVSFCIRRQKRREVLFAKGRAGFSGSARKPHWRRSGDSFYRC